MVTHSEDNSYGPTVVLINPDDEVGTLDEWLALVALSEPVELPVSAASLLEEARRLDEA